MRREKCNKLHLVDPFLSLPSLSLSQFRLVSVSFFAWEGENLGRHSVVPVDLSEKSWSNSWSAPMRSQKLNELNHELDWTSERNCATNAQSLARARPSA